MANIKIYTRTGDQGMTGLLGNRRVPKSHGQIHVIGLLDAANASLGVAIAHLPSVRRDTTLLPDVLPIVQDQLVKVQGWLFECGACVASSMTRPFAIDAYVSNLEACIDELEEDLPVLRRFILPGGGNLAAAELHRTRTDVRTLERYAQHYYRTQGNLLRFLNRLSDYLFVVARAVSTVETEWVAPQQ